MTAPPSELELLVRKQVAVQLRTWGIAAGVLFVALFTLVVYLVLEIRSIKASTVLLNEPLMIHNPAWDTVLDAVDPSRFPGIHRDDVRKGTLIRPWRSAAPLGVASPLRLTIRRVKRAGCRSALSPRQRLSFDSLCQTCAHCQSAPLSSTTAPLSRSWAACGFGSG